MNRILKGILVSSFNIDNLGNLLSNAEGPPDLEVSNAGFGQVYSTLLQEEKLNGMDFGVVWAQPEMIIEGFNKLLQGEQVAVDAIYQEVDKFTDAVAFFSKRVGNVFVASWVVPSSLRNSALMDMKPNRGISNVLMKMNLRLAEKLENHRNIFLLNAAHWVERCGDESFQPKLWYMGKIPFSAKLFKEAAADITSSLISIYGGTKKIIIVDLDDTLWGGIVGDVGWQNLRLGGHDGVGEAFVDFQKQLKALTRRGILLAIVSKNEEAVALDAIEKHPEMILKLNDFVGWKINWNDKAQNITELMKDLNLGTSSAVFIDDSSYERERVRAALPDVVVPEWPVDKMLYPKTLANLRCFETVSVTSEDIARSEMYKREFERERLKDGFESIDEWLKSLQVKAVVEEPLEENLQRTVQLLNKTNQMNLTTRRLSEAEYRNWIAQPENRLWTFKVHDRFGDLGLTGIVSLTVKPPRAEIVDFVLSCRAMGRRIEEAMLYVAYEFASSNGGEEIVAHYIATEKNKPCFDFWKTKSRFTFDENDRTFRLRISEGYEKVSSVEIIEKRKNSS
jgi:FkbH-like protein